MNALLVDDDRFVVAALEKKINWEQLTITEVLTAFNIRQAQKIIEKNSIDICVCDIEMPGGSGLDLLSWVRESGKEIQFIFLTSYADFDYAKKAIELSSLDYQLKPIDFDSIFWKKQFLKSERMLRSPRQKQTVRNGKIITAIL